MRVRALSATGDMTFGQGTSNYLVNSSAAVAQIIGTTLKLWLGEWFLNLSAGIPWSTQIAGRNTLPLATMILRSAILNVPGVTSIGSLTYTLVNRSFTVTITNVMTIYGPAGTVTVTVVVSPVISTGLANINGFLVVTNTVGWSNTSAGLAAGAVWNNGTFVNVVPGFTPLEGPPLYYGVVTSSQLLALGGATIPTTQPTAGSLQLWNNGDFVCVA
jgi:hypothetical protein